MGTVRSRMLNGVVVGRYFENLQKLVTSFREFPWTNLQLRRNWKTARTHPSQCYARRGSKSVVSRTGNDRSNITTMACGNAIGEAMPPMLIFKGKTKKSLFGYNIAASPPNSVWTYNDKAWMNEELAQEWSRKTTNSDGHGSHETLGLLDLAAEQNIYVFVLPPHTTHYLQPLYRTVFGPFNIAYKLTQLALISCHKIHVKSLTSGLFPKCWIVLGRQRLQRRTFRVALGLVVFFLWIPNAIPESAFLPSSALTLQYLLLLN